MMKNNKGQTLVTFLLLLPFLLILFGFLIDYGLLSTEKRRMENVVKENITYGLEHLESDVLKQNILVSIRNNIDGIDELEVEIVDNRIDIRVTKQVKSMYSVLVGKNLYRIVVDYHGYIDDGKIILVKG